MNVIDCYECYWLLWMLLTAMNIIDCYGCSFNLTSPSHSIRSLSWKYLPHSQFLLNKHSHLINQFNVLHEVILIIMHALLSLPWQLLFSLPAVLFIPRCKLTWFVACIGEEAAVAALASLCCHDTRLWISLAQPLSLDSLQDKFWELCE